MEENVSAEDIVNKAIEKDLDIIAITDHNCVDFCEKIIHAAKDKDLIIFPGVEITWANGSGIHLVAIFDKTTPIQDIRDFLAEIGLAHAVQPQGKEAISKKSFEFIAEKIVDYNGVLIGAHGWSHQGIFKELKGQTRLQVIQNKNLLAVETNKIENHKFLNGTDPDYKRSLACIRSSDAHKLEDIGNEYTFIKLGESTIEGLRLAFCDYESRIRYDLLRINTHPYIVGAYIDGGFLDGQVFHFNENMNTLIGGKGTGKTTTVELIRYTLNSKCKNSNPTKYSSFINGTLGNGTVYLLVKTEDNKLYFISRSEKRHKDS